MASTECWLLELRPEPFALAEAVPRYFSEGDEVITTDPYAAARFEEAGARSLASVLDRSCGGIWVAVAHAFDDGSTAASGVKTIDGGQQ